MDAVCLRSQFVKIILGMISLSDSQMQAVMTAAADLAPEKRSVFLERLAAMLNMKGRRFTDADLIAMAELARTGLAHSNAV